MKNFDVVAVGNAIVDILSKVEESFIQKHNLNKGTMALIEEYEAEVLYKDVQNSIIVSGGSASNTIAGIASLGGNVAFIGKVKNDELGKIFTHDLRALGVHYEIEAAQAGASTARSFVMVTPDAQRTMLTYLGATRGISHYDIDEEIIKNSQVTYLEGYLWDEIHAKIAMKKAVEYAKKHKRKVSLSLSDPFCVDRHRDEFFDLIKDGVDILFGNEEEVKILTGEKDINLAIKKIKGMCEICSITLGEKGAVIVTNKEEIKVEAVKNIDVIDTTGAGDLYAAGFLFGYTNDYDLKRCGQYGVYSAAEIIQHLGARPEEKLSAYIKKIA